MIKREINYLKVVHDNFKQKSAALKLFNTKKKTEGIISFQPASTIRRMKKKINLKTFSIYFIFFVGYKIGDKNDSKAYFDFLTEME